MNILDLHSGTLGLSLVLLTSSSSGMALIMARSNPVGAMAAQSWAATMAAAATAFLLWFLGQTFGTWVDFVLGNIAAVAFSMFFVRSIHLLVGTAISPRWLATQFMVGVSGVALVQLASAPRGVAVVTIAMSFLFAGVSSIITIFNNRQIRKSCWGQALIAVLAAWCLLVVGARLYALFLGGGEAVVRPMASTNVGVAALFAGTLMLVVVSLGFLAILGDQQRDAALERSRRDGLTGTLTRAAFFEQTEKHMAGAELYSIVMLDVDHFKKVNDTYGHLGGDVVLRHIAMQLQRYVRSEDIVGRYGGEEFCVFLPGCDAAEAFSVASRICQESSCHPARMLDGRSVPYTLSVGVATAGRAQGEIAAVAIEGTIDRADQALYRAKCLGRNQVQVSAASSAGHVDKPKPTLTLSDA